MTTETKRILTTAEEEAIQSIQKNGLLYTVRWLDGFVKDANDEEVKAVRQAIDKQPIKPSAKAERFKQWLSGELSAAVNGVNSTSAGHNMANSIRAKVMASYLLETHFEVFEWSS